MERENLIEMMDSLKESEKEDTAEMEQLRRKLDEYEKRGH